ncbi:hypothetical protein CH260_15655 [Rhodococcus sp. 05-2256-B2]|nr:hypothetical protein CH258_20995 [Rhodococcus sp. 05-2256-B4]OZD87359.1 hypothetical protein CH257_25225 [Rhodococcus sp. 05-2256-B3]OZD94855.1 hypothetical protein CH260_15655 [Rhodococcus sp. 05-2256-B2]OZE07893.1 hypothetical protein CH285_03970 [Rhodococcus sp. 05-2256-B1]
MVLLDLLAPPPGSERTVEGDSAVARVASCKRISRVFPRPSAGALIVRRAEVEQIWQGTSSGMWFIGCCSSVGSHPPEQRKV